MAAIIGFDLNTLAIAKPVILLLVSSGCSSTGFSGFSLEGIITVIDVEFMAWRESLTILKQLINVDPIYQKVLKKKMFRYSLYEQLRGIIKATISISDVLNY